jgi:transposase-like protein
MISSKVSGPLFLLQVQDEFSAVCDRRDFVTRFGTLRLRIARTRKQGFLPEVIQKSQRRAEEVALLIRKAFLRGISTRQVGRVVAVVTGEPVSLRNILEEVRQRDYDRVKGDAQAIYQAEDGKPGTNSFRVLLASLATALSGDRRAAGTRPAGVAELLQLASPSVEEVAHH